MIFLWIVLAFVLLIVLLLNLPVYLICDYHSKPKITLRILCFRFEDFEFIKKLLNSDKNGEKAASKDTQKSLKQQKKKKKNGSGEPLGFVEFLVHLTDVINSTVCDFFSKAKVNLKELHISLGTDDAAKTAMLSCGVIQAANGLCAALQHFSNFRCSSNNLSISPNFTSEESKFTLHLVISCTVIHFFAVYFRANMRFFD